MNLVFCGKWFHLHTIPQLALLLHSVPEILLLKWIELLTFKYCKIFHPIIMPHFVYPFFYWHTFTLHSVFSYQDNTAMSILLQFSYAHLGVESLGNTTGCGIARL